MISLKRASPMLMVLAASMAAAQPAPLVPTPPINRSAMEAAQIRLPNSEASSFERVRSSPKPFIERSDVLVVRREIMALRLACAAMPSRTYVEALPPARLGDREPPPMLNHHPYAAEEDTCAAVLSPEEAGPGYAIRMGMNGAALVLFALAFFTLIAGLLRVLWNVPLARFLPARFAQRFYG